VYAVVHNAGRIGITGAQLGEALRQRVGLQVPKRINEVRVDGIETVKGPVETAAAAGLGPAGFWLRPRLIGLGEFDWERS
jgi:hypothetical protein